LRRYLEDFHRSHWPELLSSGVLPVRESDNWGWVSWERRGREGGRDQGMLVTEKRERTPFGLGTRMLDMERGREDGREEG